MNTVVNVLEALGVIALVLLRAAVSLAIIVVIIAVPLGLALLLLDLVGIIHL